MLQNRQVALGALLMIVGVITMIPGILPNASQLSTLALIPGAASLVYGTWLVGTSGDGTAELGFPSKIHLSHDGNEYTYR